MKWNEGPFVIVQSVDPRLGDLDTSLRAAELWVQGLYASLKYHHPDAKVVLHSPQAVPSLEFFIKSLALPNVHGLIVTAPALCLHNMADLMQYHQPGHFCRQSRERSAVVTFDATSKDPRKPMNTLPLRAECAGVVGYRQGAYTAAFTAEEAVKIAVSAGNELDLREHRARKLLQVYVNERSLSAEKAFN